MERGLSQNSTRERNDAKVSAATVAGSGGANRGPAGALRATQFPVSNIFLPLTPQLDREELKPASFPHIKALRRSPMRLPSIQLSPARLFTQQSLAVAAVPEPALVEPTLASLDAVTKTTSEPLWHALLSPGSDGRNRILAPDSPEPAARLSARKSRDAVMDWGQAGEIDLGLGDSKTELPPIAEETARRIWFWQAVEGLFLSKQFSRVVAAAMVLLFASTMNVPWSSWTRASLERATQPITSAMHALSTPMRERAAFFIFDDFTDGLDRWEGSDSLQVDPAGWATLTRGFSVLSNTSELQDYRLDFETKIQSGAMGWTVRTADDSNYYRFKLNMAGSEDAPEFSLVRQAVIDGVRENFSQPVEIPSHLAKADDFNAISVRLVGDQITTLINGWGVDHWQNDQLEKGGVGLLADAGDSALVRNISVTGNDDTWGLLLYGAVESMRSVEGFFGMGDDAPTAVILFYQPGRSLAQLQQTLLLQGR